MATDRRPGSSSSAPPPPSPRKPPASTPRTERGLVPDRPQRRRVLRPSAADLRVRGGATVETALLDVTDHERCAAVVTGVDVLRRAGRGAARPRRAAGPGALPGERRGGAPRASTSTSARRVALLTLLANRFEAAGPRHASRSSALWRAIAGGRATTCMVPPRAGSTGSWRGCGTGSSIRRRRGRDAQAGVRGYADDGRHPAGTALRQLARRAGRRRPPRDRARGATSPTFPGSGGRSWPSSEPCRRRSSSDCGCSGVPMSRCVSCLVLCSSTLSRADPLAAQAVAERTSAATRAARALDRACSGPISSSWPTTRSRAAHPAPGAVRLAPSTSRPSSSASASSRRATAAPTSSAFRSSRSRPSRPSPWPAPATCRSPGRTTTSCGPCGTIRW